jgi:hypothetical protein
LCNITLENALSFKQRAEKYESDDDEEQDGCQVWSDFPEGDVFHNGEDEGSLNKKEDNCEITFFLKTK